MVRQSTHGEMRGSGNIYKDRRKGSTIYTWTEERVGQSMHG